MGSGRRKLPCYKIKHPDLYTAKLHFDELVAKQPGHKMAIYLCQECMAKDGKEVWHVGHLKKNGKAYVKFADGSSMLRKVVINQDNVSVTT